MAIRSRGLRSSIHQFRKMRWVCEAELLHAMLSFWMRFVGFSLTMIHAGAAAWNGYLRYLLGVGRA